MGARNRTGAKHRRSVHAHTQYTARGAGTSAERRRPIGGIHQMSMENGLMKMRELKSVGIDAGREVALEPGGTHIMLVDMKRPLRPGEEVTLKLRFLSRDGGAFAVTVRAPVKSVATEARHGH